MDRSLARAFISHPVHWLAFGLGTGLAPRMPGTAGTLVGVALFWGLRLGGVGVYVLATVVLAGIGIPLCGASARALGVHDHPSIVWDEVVGYLVTMVPAVVLWPVSHLWFWMLVGFVLFRLFDITKPGPIRWLDRGVHGGFGIMVDDLAAGAAGAACLWLLLWWALR